jgi:tRNA C32,U32 (ribose-2'-O)-methylase TrmJ
MFSPSQIIAVKEWIKDGGKIALSIDCPDDEMFFIRSSQGRVIYCSPKTLDEFKQALDDATFLLATTDVKRLKDERE